MNEQVKARLGTWCAAEPCRYWCFWVDSGSGSVDVELTDDRVITNRRWYGSGGDLDQAMTRALDKAEPK